jgi:hypothetical protein
MPTKAAELFELGRQSLQALISELEICNIYVDAGLELRYGEGLLCHYNLKDEHIYLSVPDSEKTHGKFELLFLRSVINFDSSDEIMRFLELLTPWLIAHETGHYLRHKYGLFGTNLWEEEQIANQLAIAFTRRWLTSAQTQEILDLLARAIANLSHLLEVDSEPMNDDSTRDPVRYVYTHMRWFYRDLTAHESQTIAEFVQIHLKQRKTLYSGRIGMPA